MDLDERIRQKFQCFLDGLPCHDFLIAKMVQHVIFIFFKVVNVAQINLVHSASAFQVDVF